MDRRKAGIAGLAIAPRGPDGKKAPLESSEWVNGYRKHLKATKAPRTVWNYTWSARSFESFLESKGHSIEEAPSSALKDYVVYLLDEKKISPRSLKAIINGVRNYLKWLNGRIPIPVFAEPDLPRLCTKREYTPEKEDIDRYEDAVRAMVFKEPCRTVLLLLPHCGLRISEICRLSLKESINQRTIGGRVWTTFTTTAKGGDVVEVPLMPPGEKVFSAYLFGWRSRLDRKSKWLFPGNWSHPIAPDTVRKYLNKVRDLLGMPMLSPHAIRRFFATYQYYVKGNDLLTVSKMVGHKTTKTTELYYINPKIMQVLSNVKT